MKRNSARGKVNEVLILIKSYLGDAIQAWIYFTKRNSRRNNYFFPRQILGSFCISKTRIEFKTQTLLNESCVVESVIREKHFARDARNLFSTIYRNSLKTWVALKITLVRQVTVKKIFVAFLWYLLNKRLLRATYLLGVGRFLITSYFLLPSQNVEWLPSCVTGWIEGTPMIWGFADLPLETKFAEA